MGVQEEMKIQMQRLKKIFMFKEYEEIVPYPT